ncbi:TlpA family protein disulfide reductase [Lysobacter koreensis]|uniref:TlpA family protein disulfide reductase n=1 Tax=Lysobacter koreensis TaxID=266122 RepID=A0ABW2YQ36_9GAMM
MPSSASPVLLLSIALLLAACKPAPPGEQKPAAGPAPTTAAPATRPTKTSPTPSPDAARATPVIPALRIATLDGTPYELSAHRGKWVVLNFWATWCAPCLKEMPELSALDAMRENIEVVGLAYEDIEPADMRAFLKKHPVVYPIAIVDTYDPPKDFDTPRGLPTTYLIAPDGTVAKKFLGPVTAREIEAAIAAGKVAP